ncbi:MAG TPA: M28 family peptidase [Blastocatellia bacterium]|nr:M28 family peptidase [Blastocatellia bacterium]
MKSGVSVLARVACGSLVFAGLILSAPARQLAPAKVTLTPELQAVMERITADSLRGHLSFIASDLLEGRNTPSKGLDLAAEYIAAQFRRAGVEPAGNDGYFQTAPWIITERPMDAFECKLETAGESLNVSADQVSIGFDSPLNLSRAGLVKVVYRDPAALTTATAAEFEGKVVVTEIPDFRREDRSRWNEMFRAQNEFLSKLASLKVALVVSVDRINPRGSGGGAGRLIDPENRTAFSSSPSAPLLTIHDPRIVKLYDEMKAGATGATLSVRTAAPVEKPIKLRNVVGLLRGSDPMLKDTYVLVTAHYDHVGVRPNEHGDSIFNGANDDGSGTVSVIELASALASLKTRPKRSIVFMTFFGEEKGLLGSRYYGRHPIFPIDKTVADVNLEQVGRTDSTEGPQTSNATLTGFDYSDVGAIFKAAGEATGITVYKHERNSDAYFGRSDNQALADRGVPAHTLCVAFAYPDYHGAGDHWDKIDYENMAKVDRMVAVALLTIANSLDEPKWNEANARAARYIKASREIRGK